MEIDRTITTVWTVEVNEKDVLDRFIDETIHEGERRSVVQGRAILASDDDRAILHRYYCNCLAELSALLAKRTRRVGGNIVNETDEETKLIHTCFHMPMTANHEDALLQPLASHCLEFLVASLMEKWYGHGSDFGSNAEKQQIRDILNYRRYPVERPFSSIL